MELQPNPVGCSAIELAGCLFMELQVLNVQLGCPIETQAMRTSFKGYYAGSITPVWTDKVYQLALLKHSYWS